ncbi:MAG: universal stress protein [Alphaproteobacteria bacterium]|nr:universal stress protein [Alphaproteobacteria bacterium]MCB9697231.1 universal stress protein [Alphaproteobacteria bacterium]
MTRPIVLVPHDLTDFSDPAIQAVLQAPWAGSQVHVVHVLPRFDLGYPGVVYSQQDDEPRRQHALTALAERLEGRVEDPVLHVVIGDPGTRIVELAKEIGATSIILPSHGRQGLERLMLGSVAEHVARFAPCPVVVLPTAVLQSKERRARPTGRTRDELVDELGTEICARVDAQRGAFLTALRVGLPTGEDEQWWEDALEKRLAAAGIEFVDLVFSPSPRPAVLAARFEQRWA